MRRSRKEIGNSRVCGIRKNSREIRMGVTLLKITGIRNKY